MDKNMFFNLYKSLVRPHLEYATVVLSPHFKKILFQQIMLNAVQRA